MATASSSSEFRDDEATDETDPLFPRLRKWYQDHASANADWKTQAKEDYAFVAGDQWSQEDVEKLKEQLRPCITFNRVGPVIDSVAGMEVGNRQEVTYLPREVNPQDGGISELLTHAAQFFRDESEAEDEESDAFQDAIICGIGCTETRPDFEQDSDGLIPTDRLDPLCMFWDPSARKRNLTDRRYCGYVKKMPIEDARALVESLGVTDYEDEDLHAAWADGREDESPHDATPANAYNHDTGESVPADGQVNIVYFEWWEREPYHVVADPTTGRKTEFSKADFAKLKKRLKQIGEATGQPMPEIKSAQLTKKVHKQAFLGSKVLWKGPGRCPDEFTVNFITGKRDRNNNTWYGLVRGMKDPQRWANKFFSTILHRISTTGKGVVIEETAVKNPRNFEENWTRADGVKWVKDGAISRGQFQQLEGTAIVPAESAMLEFAVSSIRDVTGVNLELLGMADREQAGVLEYQRKQAGMTILATLFDSLRRYRKQQGRALLYIIQEYIPAGRLIRIDGELGPQYVQLAKSQDNTKYDVIVDEASSSPNLKEGVWASLMQLMPLLAKLPIPPQMWLKMLEYSPLPQSLVQDVKQIAQQEAMQPPPPDPKMQLAQVQAQIAQQKAQTDAAAKQQDMRIAQQTAQLDFVTKQQEMEFERQKFAMESQQDAARFQQEMHQQQLMGAVKVNEAQAMGQQKLQQAEQQGELRQKQMAAQAKAKPAAKKK